MRFHTEKHDLVGGIPTPLKNMSSSVGVMTFPIYGKINNVPNHQPVMYDLKHVRIDVEIQWTFRLQWTVSGAAKAMFFSSGNKKCLKPPTR